MAEALRHPDQYYVQYGFTEEQLDDERITRLRVRFAPNLLQRLVSEAGLPLWSANRPVLMIWAAVDGVDGVEILAADSLHPLAAALADHAKLRGLPIVFVITSYSIHYTKLYEVATPMASASSVRRVTPTNGHRPRNCASTKLFTSTALMSNNGRSSMALTLRARPADYRTTMPGVAPASGASRKMSRPPGPAASTIVITSYSIHYTKLYEHRCPEVAAKRHLITCSLVPVFDNFPGDQY